MKSKKSPILTSLIYIIAVFAGIFILANIITRFYVGLFYIVIGLILLPKIHRGIEKILRFSFNWKVKTGVITLLMIPIFILTPRYIAKEKHVEELKRVEEANRIQKEKEEKAEKERFEKMRIDSLNYYSLKADNLKKRKKYSAANENYGKALTPQWLKYPGELHSSSLSDSGDLDWKYKEVFDFDSCELSEAIS
ncbi:MAG: hypothetical protein HC831_13135 [Chloroflexia bacterium]|nr:hypothetical protein [Chloroflexia bacterium]